MFLLRKLSGESQQEQEVSIGRSSSQPSPSSPPMEKAKNVKRHRSGPVQQGGLTGLNPHAKRKKFSKSTGAALDAEVKASLEEGELQDSSDSESENEAEMVEKLPVTAPVAHPLVESDARSLLPPETPSWGIKLLEVMQNEFRLCTKSMSEETQTNTKAIVEVQKKLAKVELKNESLEKENVLLREKILDIEFRQRRNNLIFEGIKDSDNESDRDCILKLRSLLCNIPGLDSGFKLDRCYRLDGAFKPTKTRRILCTFNWHVDVQFILRNRRRLPKGIYVNEDLPEEWVD